MEIGIPFDVQPTHVIASNVELETEWTAGTYTGGTVRRVGNYAYEVVAGVSTEDEPTAGAGAEPPTWINLGLANRYRAFDGELGRGVERSGDIQMTIQVPDVINTIYLTGLVGTSLIVEVFEGGEVLANQTYGLTDDTGIDNVWDYIYGPIEPASERVLQDLPSVYRSEIRITVTAGEGVARIGEAVLTRAQKYGTTRPGLNLGILDFSEKEPGTFGGYDVVERGFAGTSNVEVVTRTQAEVEKLFSVLVKRRAKPTLYIGAKRLGLTIVYGFYRDVKTVLETDDISIFDIELRSLTDA